MIHPDSGQATRGPGIHQMARKVVRPQANMVPWEAFQIFKIKIEIYQNNTFDDSNDMDCCQSGHTTIFNFTVDRG